MALAAISHQDVPSDCGLVLQLWQAVIRCSSTYIRLIRFPWFRQVVLDAQYRSRDGRQHLVGFFSFFVIIFCYLVLPYTNENKSRIFWTNYRCQNLWRGNLNESSDFVNLALSLWNSHASLRSWIDLKVLNAIYHLSVYLVFNGILRVQLPTAGGDTITLIASPKQAHVQVAGAAWLGIRAPSHLNTHLTATGPYSNFDIPWDWRQSSSHSSNKSLLSLGKDSRVYRP